MRVVEAAGVEPPEQIPRALSGLFVPGFLRGDRDRNHRPALKAAVERLSHTLQSTIEDGDVHFPRHARILVPGADGDVLEVDPELAGGDPCRVPGLVGPDPCRPASRA